MRLTVVLVVALLSLGLSPPQATAQTKKDVPDLVKKLQSPFSSDVTKAAQALGKLGPDAKDAAKPLAEALGKARFNDEFKAILQALGNIGPSAKHAVPGMTKQLKAAKFSSERLLILEALGDIGWGAKGAIPTLEDWAKNGPFLDERRAAEKVLKQIQKSERERAELKDEGERG